MELNWYKSSLILSTELHSILEKKECGDVLLGTIKKDNGTNYVFPYGTNIFIADEERVRDSENLTEILRYYETKVKPSESEAIILRVADDSLEETKFIQRSDIDRLFSTLLEQVYLDLQGISSISDFPYSIIHEICDSDKKNRGYLSFLLEFISLCALSTRVLYDDLSKKYIFRIGSKIDSEFQKIIHLETVWNDTAFFTSNIFSTITTWVVDDKGIPDGQHLRRSVAQNYILGFEDSPGLLTKTQEEIRAIPNSLNNMFDSVLNARSEKYIQKINKMKDEYVDSFNQYSQMMASVNTQTVSNIFAITAAVYGLFLTKEGLESPVSFLSFKIILGFFVFTTGLILLVFRSNLISLRESMNTRRRFYSEMLGVTDKTLEEIYKRLSPSQPITWRIPFITLIFILFILLVFIFIPKTHLPDVIQGFFT